jgi:hypothetical protein
MQIKQIAIIPAHERRKRPFQHGVSFQTQLPAAGEIYRQYTPFAIKGEITDRGVIIEIDVASSGFLKMELGPAQFLVLQRKFDLMHLQLMDKRRDIIRCDILNHLCLFGKQLFRSFPHFARCFSAAGFFIKNIRGHNI